MIINDKLYFIFNSSYGFTILRAVADPKFLTIEEQKLVNFFSTLRPNRLNFENPVSVGINYLRNS